MVPAAQCSCTCSAAPDLAALNSPELGLVQDDDRPRLQIGGVTVFCAGGEVTEITHGVGFLQHGAIRPCKQSGGLMHIV